MSTAQLTPFVEEVRERLGELATPGVLTFAETVERLVGADGWAPAPKEVLTASGLSADDARPALAALVDSGLLGVEKETKRIRIRYEVHAEPAPIVESKSKAWTRKPNNQNEYALRVWNDYHLTSTQKLILMGLAIEFGMEHGRTGKPFGECTTEAANSYIRGHAKIGETAARENLAALVELGWLRRLDAGKGGRGGRGRAVYLPTLPGSKPHA